MKLVVLLGDGMADLPLAALQGKTPLQAAKKPNMDRLARQGKSGLAQTVPEGFPPGSDVANLSVMGYAPGKHYSGRAPLEAAAMGVALGEADIAFRCNFVTIEDGIMKDYSAGHITSEEGRELIEALQPLMPGQAALRRRKLPKPSGLEGGSEGGLHPAPRHQRPARRGASAPRPGQRAAHAAHGSSPARPGQPPREQKAHF